ncbi:tautomerase family protein [Thermoactinospora rubra]|uniref:tautomerase family protein n=1 Tax=Thermoactinospora rubra TaxID=1088767 RepID=UPI000A0F7330|nr:tautomerase family protein [Thermoactinospora rubra]
MAHVKLYGRRDVWAERRREASDAVHECLVQEWGLPEDKRFHRFFLMDAEDFLCPQRGESYLIVEILCFAGRSEEAKRRLHRAISARFDEVEIIIVESPKVNWGIRGVPADELALPYRVEV